MRCYILGIKSCFASITILSVFLFIGCGLREEYSVIRGQTMGTYYAISYGAGGECVLQKDDVDSLLVAINNSLSTYQPDSELSIVNRARVTGKSSISQELFFVLSAAELVWRQTEGAFDVTIGPLINLWGFGPSKKSSVPSSFDEEQIKTRIGMKNLVLNSGALFKKQDNMYIDLSAIAKGYAVDRVASLFEDRGCSDYLVDIGGESKVKGHNASGDLWRIGIEKPGAGINGAQAVLQLSNVGIATSGNYRNFRQIGSGKVSHVMDPRSGKPSNSRVASATVLHESVMMADAYATSIMVLGVEEGMRFAVEHDLPVFMILEEPSGGFRERYNKLMENYIRLSID